MTMASTRRVALFLTVLVAALAVGVSGEKREGERGGVGRAHVHLLAFFLFFFPPINKRRPRGRRPAILPFLPPH